MNNYKRLNNIFGLVAFVISFIVYALTAEPTASFWDCGEFISASYTLQVVHPPGAPLFLLIGRVFSLFAPDVQHVAFMVNMVSVLTSALTVMFTFWITTYFAKKIVLKLYGDLSSANIIAILGAGLVGGLTLTFSDTFWFSAVEAEVYASSSFFMAITFWAVLKWEEHADERHADRWLVLIAFLIGLALCVHLLSLLVIPAVVYVYYFRRYTLTTRGLILAGVIGFAILGFVQVGIISGIPTLAAQFDLFFVNSMDAPFNSGVFFFLILLVALLTFGLIWTRRKGYRLANLGVLCTTFIIIGYATYVMVVVRSLANPPIDMNNPEDPFSLVYYLNREQYGERPLIRGPYYNTRLVDIEETSNRYMKGKEKYDVTDKNRKLIWDPNNLTYFPRIYDANDPQHVQGYKSWAGIRENEKPKFVHNVIFFWRYQLGWMYWRYFMWNFSGRQNEEQGYQGPMNGNWISGINFIDDARLGPQENLPDSMKNNRGKNKYFMLPFILGLLGLIFHIRKDKNNAFILGIMFVITGVLLIVYLNPPPFEPRERDYVFVGSFQVFCSWVGLGVLYLFTLMRKKLNPAMAGGIASVVGLLAAPALMASQNWDDHDRSNRYMTIDFARDYLESCPKNAILFTNGDNDTYPLWYAQNVEGVRTDVRVINYSLLAASEYADGLQRPVFDSPAIKFTFKPDQYRNGTRDVVEVVANRPGFDQNSYYELKPMMQFVATDSKSAKVMNPRSGKEDNYFPAKKFKITIDKQKAISSGWVKERDSALVVPEMRFELPGGGERVYKNGLLLMDIVANNIGERPICFTATTGADVYFNLMPYFESHSLVYVLKPIYTPTSREMGYGRIDTDDLYNLMVKTYKWGGMEDRVMYVDEKATLVPYNVRGHFYRLASAFLDEGKKEKAIEVLDHSQKSIPNYNMPFTPNMVAYVDLYYKAGATDKAEALMDILATDAAQKVKYFGQFHSRLDPRMKDERDYALQILENCVAIARSNKREDKAKQIEAMYQ